MRNLDAIEFGDGGGRWLWVGRLVRTKNITKGTVEFRYSMIVLLFLIPVSLVIALVFLVAFVWAVRSGQFEDTQTPALRMLPQDVCVKQQPETLPLTTKL